jgi:SAM-dependent methyltransferase
MTTAGGASPTDLFAVPRLVTGPEDCFFYHSMDLPVHGSVEGNWDLRGHESQYLGGVSFDGKRVLEIGPASGHLSFFMERQGAEVVSVEAEEDYPWEFCWDLPDLAPVELGEKLKSHREMMRRVKNSYWLAHRAFESKAKVHYGSAYSLPRELGTFDISVIGCVLLHNKNPLQMLENCARQTKETLVVVEIFRESQLVQSPAVFLPTASERLWHTWWGFSPVYFVDVLRSMGFSEQRVTFHRQTCLGGPTTLFTVVASRQASSDAPSQQASIHAELSTAVDSLKPKAGQLMTIPVSIVNRGEVPISSLSEHPVLLSYHWRTESGEAAVWDGLRTALPRTLYPGDRDDLLLTIRVPSDAGSYVLEITMLEEHVTWYDDRLPGLPLRIRTTVTPR